MAVRKQSVSSAGSRRAWLVAVSLLVLFAAALFLRAYWNLDAATQDGQFVLSGGSDPYYHKRAVDAIQENGYRTLYDDPLLNYPYGAVNPNPPLYEWSIAVAGQLMAPMFGGDLETSTWWAMLWSPAVFGALTLFPIFFITRALFDWRAGLVAALFWVLSTSAIDTGGLGDADHDAAIMFFASLAFLFYIQAITRFRGDQNWVTNWRDGSSVGSGLARFFRERQAGLLYALMTAVAIAAVALTWKGFPYVIGILFIYAGIQMVIDHWRNRDSLGIFTATFIAITLGTLLAYPYYAAAGVQNFVTPVWFIIGGFLVAGLVFVPTRDLPTILVMPAAAVVGILGVIAAFFIVPEVAFSLLYATVYFKRTALYETIAEAHPADFSSLVFGLGPVPFFAALFGWFTLAFTARKHPTRPILFALVWGAVALFMANSAIRFLHNAIPVFAVFAGFMTMWVIDWLEFGSIRKSMAANQGQAWTGFRKGVRPLQIVVVILAALLLVFPNTMLAADAALPPEKERQLAEESESAFVRDFMSKRFGAYGQGFIPSYWREALTWLDQHDAAQPDPAKRGAFLSWWDYGHWAIAIGNHPATADNFQNGYVHAAYFLLSQNESHAIQLFAARLVDDIDDARAEQILRDVGVTDAAAARVTLEKMGCRNQGPECSDGFLHELDVAGSAELLAKVEEASGKKIRYFATDVRMLPYDDPQTRNIEQSSIYYAPIRLAGRNADDYVPAMINTGTAWVTQDQFRELARDPTRQISGTSERLEYKQTFFNSMYWRGYVGQPVETAPGQPTLGDSVDQALRFSQPAHGLTHFRLVYANDGVKILEYTPGARVSGVLTEEGAPLDNVDVTVYDDASGLILEGYTEEFRAQVPPDAFNVPHATTKTDAAGRYSLVAPFNLEGGNVTVVATRGDVELARQHLTISRDDASMRKEFTADLQVQRGNVEGFVYDDVDANGQYNASVDTLAAGVELSIGGKTATTDAEGKYRIESVSAGSQTVNVTSDDKTVASASATVRVQPGQTATHNVALVDKPGTLDALAYADLNGNGAFDDGEGIAFTSVEFAPAADVTPNPARAASGFTDSSGNFTQQLAAGTYTVTATFRGADGSTYALVDERLEVAGGASLTREFMLVKQ